MFFTLLYYIPQAIFVILVKYYGVYADLFSPSFQVLLAFSSIIAYVSIFYFFWKPKINYSDILDVKGFGPHLFPYFLIVAIGFFLVGQPFSDYNQLFEYFKNADFKPFPWSFRAFTLYDFYRHISILIISPIFEELFFRKFLFSKLLEKYKLYVAISVSSVCFSAIHFETPTNLIPAFIFGIISALIYFKTKKISYSIILHFFINACISFLNIYGESYFVWLDGFKFDLLYWALFVLGIVLIVFGGKQINSVINKQN